MENDLAPRSTRILSWLILGAFSTTIAEVIAGSDIYPFFKVTDYLIVIPLYTLHTLVLWYLVWSRGKPRLYNLFPAGALFGLYEAYLTKVIWNPTWAGEPIKFAGIAVVETLLLVLFWHCFLAFIVPLLLAEMTLTNSSEIISGLKGWECILLARLQNGYSLFALVFIAGFFQSINIHSVYDAIFSGVSTTLIISTLIWLWRRKNRFNYSMRSLLPTAQEFKILVVLIAVMYVWMGSLWRPEALPGIGPQLIVVVLYLFFAGLLAKGLKKSRSDAKGCFLEVQHIVCWRLILYGIVFSLGSLVGFLSGLSVFMVYIVWLSGIGFGLFVLYRTLRELFW